MAYITILYKRFNGDGPTAVALFIEGGIVTAGAEITSCSPGFWLKDALTLNPFPAIMTYNLLFAGLNFKAS